MPPCRRCLVAVAAADPFETAKCAPSQPIARGAPTPSTAARRRHRPGSPSSATDADTAPPTLHRRRPPHIPDFHGCCHSSSPQGRLGHPAEPSSWPGATSSRARALALTPHIEPRGAYFLLALTTGKETEIEPQGARIAPHPPPSTLPYACCIGLSRPPRGQPSFSMVATAATVVSKVRRRRSRHRRRRHRYCHHLCRHRRRCRA